MWEVKILKSISLIHLSPSPASLMCAALLKVTQVVGTLRSSLILLWMP